MSTLPRAVKIQALHEVGVKIDDGLEPAKINTARWESARTALTGAINDIIKSTKDSKLDTNSVMHCVKILQGLVTQASANYYTALGAEKQIESHVSLIKKMYDFEVALKMREEEPLPPVENAVERRAPARTIREQRLAAAAAEKRSEEIVAQSAPEPAPAAAPVPEPKPAPTPAPTPAADEKLPSKKRGPKSNRKNQDPAPAAEAPAVEVEVDVSELEGSEVSQEVKLVKKGNSKKRNMSA